MSGSIFTAIQISVVFQQFADVMKNEAVPRTSSHNLSKATVHDRTLVKLALFDLKSVQRFCEGLSSSCL